MAGNLFPTREAQYYSERPMPTPILAIARLSRAARKLSDDAAAACLRRQTVIGPTTRKRGSPSWHFG